MRRDHASWAILNLRVDIKNVDLALCSSLLLIEVRHHLEYLNVWHISFD